MRVSASSAATASRARADVTLDEPRAELIYPLGEQADDYFRGRR